MKLTRPNPDDMTPYMGFRSDKERRRALGTHVRWKYGSWALCVAIAAVATVVLFGLPALI